MDILDEVGGLPSKSMALAQAVGEPFKKKTVGLPTSVKVCAVRLVVEMEVGNEGSAMPQVRGHHLGHPRIMIDPNMQIGFGGDRAIVLAKLVR